MKFEEEKKKKDNKLKMAAEEIERQKKYVEELKREVMEASKCNKSEYDGMVGEIKKLEKQKTELVIAFRKQMKLIDILKKQKIHLEASQAIKFTEDEFLNILNLSSTTTQSPSSKN